MKKLCIVCLTLFLLFTACKKKEEPKGVSPVPSGPLSSQNEVMQLQELIRQDPKNLTAWIQLGNVCMDTARFQEAIDAYQKALELDGKNVDVRVDMGTCYKNIGKPDRAAEEYKKALSMNPRHLNAHRNLAVVLAFDLKDTRGAVKEFQEYLRLAPDAPDAEQVKQLIAKLKSSS